MLFRSSFLLCSLLLCCLTGSPLVAQDAPAQGAPATHAAFVDKLLTTLADRNPDLTATDREWLTTFLDAGCDCKAFADREQQQTCGEELFKKLELPVTEKEYLTITPEQTRKLSLLTPLLSTVGRCPEHK